MSAVIDAHHHFWVYGQDEQAWRGPAHDAIARDYTPEDLQPCLRESGVDATVLVQSVDTAEENERLLRYAAHAGFVAGVLAWLPLRAPALARSMIPALAAEPRVRGVRCLIGREDTAWLTDAETVRVFRDLARAGLCWDVVPVTEGQVRDVTAVARTVPDLRIVIDHLARPPVESDGWQPWAEQVGILARMPNLAVKVSVGIDVLTDWPQWSAERLRRYVGRVAETFGPERMMLASNWPVIELRRSHREAWSDLRAAAGMAGADLEAISGGTAAHWYGLFRV